MKTTTLEQSKRLKELGAPQDTYHQWFNHHQTNDSQWELEQRDWKWLKAVCLEQAPSAEYYAAYTLEELIEWLPSEYVKDVKYYFHLDWIGQKWLAGYSDSDMKDDKSIQNCSGKTPLEACYNLAIAVKSQEDHAVTKN